MVSEQRTLIIAGNARQAEDYRRTRGLSRHQVIYATPSSLRGVTLDDRWTIAHVGTWRLRKDLVHLLEYVSICQVAATTDPRRVYVDA